MAKVVSDGRFRQVYLPLAVSVGLLVVVALGFIVPVSAEPASVVTNDIAYGNADGTSLLMDLARPASGNGPFPAVVCIHGGGWQGGDKRDFAGEIREFADAGYVAISINYRMAPHYKWPAMIEDCKCAVRHLRAHAKELNIDPNRICATGASAGGHLSLMLGLTSAKDGLEGDGGDQGVSSAVQAVANFFGPTDMRLWKVLPKEGSDDAKEAEAQTLGLLTNVLGTADRGAPVMAQMSPVTYVDAHDPPILTFHGNKDNIVDVSQAKLLDEALAKAGVPHKLVIVDGAGHGWGGEKMKESIRETLGFFKAHLHLS